MQCKSFSLIASSSMSPFCASWPPQPSFSSAAADSSPLRQRRAQSAAMRQAANPFHSPDAWTFWSWQLERRIHRMNRFRHAITERPVKIKD